MLAGLAAEEVLGPMEAARLLERIEEITTILRSLRAPVQPLHADAHLNNVLNGPDGPLWNDWEDTCIGPLGWDAACLLNSSQGPERAEAAYAASGMRLNSAELKLWQEARELQVSIWRAFLKGV